MPITVFMTTGRSIGRSAYSKSDCVLDLLVLVLPAECPLPETFGFSEMSAVARFGEMPVAERFDQMPVHVDQKFRASENRKT